MRVIVRAGLVLATVVAGIGGAVGTAAAAECKTIATETTCRTTAGCGWVNGYTISKGKYKGKVVKPFCRKKAVRAASGSPTPTMPAATPGAAPK